MSPRARTALQPHATPPERDPQLLHHRPHRPRQVDAGRPDAADHRRRRRPRHARPVPRPDGHRARARHHDQVPGRAPAVGRSTAQHLRAEHDRHPRPRRLHLRGVAARLAACEGAVLLVDAAQGIEAQTLANLYLALENDLTIIPVLNKIDLPAAQPEKYAEELAHLIGCEPEDCLRVSGKTGVGRRAAARRDRARRSRPRRATPNAPARAMIFDSVYDTYRGVVTYVRVIDGNLNPRERIVMMSTRATHELLEIGVISPEPVPGKGLGVGEVGYLITGVKDVRQSPGRRHRHQRWPSRPADGARRLPRPQADGVLRPVPDRRLRLPRPARRPRQAQAQRRRAGLRAGDLGRARLRLPRAASSACCTSRSSASGSSASSTSTSSRPRPTSSTRCTMDDGSVDHRHQPQRVPRRQDRRGPRARSCAPRSSRRASSSARSWSCARAAPRHPARHGLPLRGPRRDALHAAARRDRLRLLRPAQVAHPRLRLLDYEPDGEQAADLVKVDILLQGETGRRVQRDRAQGQGLRATA